MINSKGLPYGVQVMTMPYQDERCLRLMKVIDDMFRFDKNPIWLELKHNIKSLN